MTYKFLNHFRSIIMSNTPRSHSERVSENPQRSQSSYTQDKTQKQVRDVLSQNDTQRRVNNILNGKK